jgi:hypothetical protein
MISCLMEKSIRNRATKIIVIMVILFVISFLGIIVENMIFNNESYIRFAGLLIVLLGIIRLIYYIYDYYNQDEMYNEYF